jgi:HTH-type transcriptional regulator / antitoxin HipB
MQSHIKSGRLGGLPEAMLQELRATRRRFGWSQAELGRRVGLPQMHISGIESGKIVPRFDTLLDLTRILGFDPLLIPRALVPAVQAMVRDHRSANSSRDADREERPLYAAAEWEANERHDEV